jgi:hypothetical protein
MDLLLPQFDQPQTLAVAGVSAGLLQTWANRAVGLPAKNPGSGRRRLYSAADVVKLTIMGRLARFGIPGSTCENCAALIVGELVRRGEIEWQLHLALRASRDEANVFAIEVIASSPLDPFNPTVGDARKMYVSQFTEAFEGVFSRRDRTNDNKIDPNARERLARQGIHAEPCLVFPVGEIVNATLLRLTDIADAAGKQP